MTLPRKTVIDNGIPVGEASTKGEARRVLVRGGYTEREAEAAIQTRCVEAPDAFHIVAARDLDRMMADLRAIRACAAAGEAGA